MEQFKREHFAKDHPGKTFPRVDLIPASVCEGVSSEIAERLGLSTPLDRLSLIKTIRSESVGLPAINAESPEFNLFACLKQCNLSIPENVYLNWRRFETLDRMSTMDVSRRFEYLWYPAADDLEIVATDISWILSVAHSGEIYLLRLSQRRQN
jgi:hypothetical protein